MLNPPVLPLEVLYTAWRSAKRKKKPSMNMLAFEADWLGQLLAIQEVLAERRWQPQRPVCFVTTHPKTREIHAPDFSDRVVHHYLVPQLEALYEPVFIHDSYANRAGKGSHAAVDRVQQFMRQENGGYYLQLDIHNFFNSINRHVLYRQLGQRLAKAERQGKITGDKHHELKTLCHSLLRHKPGQNARYRGTAEEHARVPPHKRLMNARSGCGLAIGNLTSQFFANVYLNALDQFVKHTLKCRHYVRYVDDFVLLHHDPQQLLEWRGEIEAFLAKELHLSLKRNSRQQLPQPQPAGNGCDFLGYVIYPHHKVVRRRVIQHCRKKLREWSERCKTADPLPADAVLPLLRRGSQVWPPLYNRGGAPQGRRGQSLCGIQEVLSLPAAARQHIRALVASYWGHFGHAGHWRLTQTLLAEFPWLGWLFVFRPALPPVARFACGAVNYFSEQVAFYRQMYPGCRLRVQKGYEWVDIAPASAAPGQTLPVIEIHECGWLRHGLKRREVRRIVYA